MTRHTRRGRPVSSASCRGRSRCARNSRSLLRLTRRIIYVSGVGSKLQNAGEKPYANGGYFIEAILRGHLPMRRIVELTRALPGAWAGRLNTRM